MKKRFLALARVSSREQEREGFSLDVQEEALQRYAEHNNGEIVKFYRIAETASKREERGTFRDLLTYARENASHLDGLLFYKVDRAARNLFDYVELERLENDHGVPVVYVAQPTENTPAGRMQRRILANMATFYTEQQSLDVKEGMERRVKNGLFVGKAPYGYRNVRIDGRGLVEVHPEHGPKVSEIFHRYAFHGHTLDSLREHLFKEGIFYTKKNARFPRSKLHAILRDRAYVGEVAHQESWYPGTHKPLVELAIFRRVQILLGEKIYSSQDSVYGSGMITCGHCGRPLVVEIKRKKTRQGPRVYRYYRCAGYNAEGHPRVRIKENDLDTQVLGLFDKMRIEDEKIRAWIVKVLRAKAGDFQKRNEERFEQLKREMTEARKKGERLLSLRIDGEIDSETFKKKNNELQEQIDVLGIQIDGSNRSHRETAELAVKVFELSQALKDKWVTADIDAKRQILQTVCLNYSLEDVTLTFSIRKPFDVIAKGLVSSDGRGDWI